MTAPAKTLRDQTRNDDGSLIMALLFAVAALVITAAFAATALASNTQTRQSRDFTVSQQAADTAMNDALRLLNVGATPTLCTDAESNRARGTIESVTWTYCGTPVATGWSITANVKSKNGSIDRTFGARLDGTEVASATDASGDILYTSSSTATRGLNLGFFGADEAVLRNVTVNHSGGEAPGEIGSNGRIDIADTTAEAIALRNSGAKPYNDRCHDSRGGEVCNGARKVLAGINMGEAAVRDINAICAGQRPVPWRASTSANTLKRGTCYSSLDFDTTAATTMAGPTTETVVYVTGSVTVAANARAGATATNPALTLIHSAGKTVSLGGGAQVALGLYAPRATCATNETGTTGNARVINGAMVCLRLSINTGTKPTVMTYWSPFAAVPTDTSARPRVWDMKQFREN